MYRQGENVEIWTWEQALDESAGAFDERLSKVLSTEYYRGNVISINEETHDRQVRTQLDTVGGYCMSWKKFRTVRIYIWSKH